LKSHVTVIPFPNAFTRQLLNNFLPKYVDNGLQKQQNQIRKWLMQDVPMSPWIKDIMERQKQREKDAAGAGKGASV
jgi:hypothetical protein